jgi:hypothetical protein
MKPPRLVITNPEAGLSAAAIASLARLLIAFTEQDSKPDLQPAAPTEADPTTSEREGMKL